MFIKLSATLSLLLASTLTLAQQTPFSIPSIPKSNLHPTHISQSVDVGGSLTRATTVYTLKQDSASGSNEFVVGLKGREPFVEAWIGKTSYSKKVIEVKKLGSDNNITYFSLLLPSGAQSSVSVHTVTSHVTTPRPKVLAQTADTVSMLWSADLLDLVVGFNVEDRANIQEIKVKVKTPTPRILEKKAPSGFELMHSKGGATVLFTSVGSLEGQGPQVAEVLYHQVDPLVSIRKLDRLIEVSHWGSNLAVVDSIDLVNTGPELKGFFSRLDHQRAMMQRRPIAHAITSLSFTLPPRIHSPYYIDIVGNVSTSRFRASPNPLKKLLPSQKNKAGNSILEITPRYPLMGGWNYTFTIGYDAPLEDFVKKSPSGSFVLAVPFLTPVTDVAVDAVELSIRLPEGARNIRVHTPFPVDSLSYPSVVPALSSLLAKTNPNFVKTYLDSTGRPTVVMEKAHCGDRNGGSVVIEYDIPVLFDLLQKPLAAAAVLFTLLMGTVSVRRLQWTI